QWPHRRIRSRGGRSEGRQVPTAQPRADGGPSWGSAYSWQQANALWIKSVSLKARVRASGQGHPIYGGDARIVYHELFFKFHGGVLPAQGNWSFREAPPFHLQDVRRHVPRRQMAAPPRAGCYLPLVSVTSPSWVLPPPRGEVGRRSRPGGGH